MESAKKQVSSYQKSFVKLKEQIGLSSLREQRDDLARRMLIPGFWSDTLSAAEITKKHAALEARIEPWDKLESDLSDMAELLALDDDSVLADIKLQLSGVDSRLGKLEASLRFDGPYDHYDAIISIYAGAGGTDAQDWAEMLLRMYLRWLESKGFKVSVVDESAGEEAGIKSVTIEVSGELAYGQLKNEHGVHRLVRLSPFNSDNLRQTSFAKVEVVPRINQPDEVDIDDRDLKIDVYRSGGKGGQGVNTTDSAVRITHLPTGISVAIQNERSQLQNKETAMTILRSRLTQLKIEHHLEKLADLKGVSQSAEWGNQIRNYVMHPYKLVKDLRSGVETSDVESVLDGELDNFINANIAVADKH